MGFLLFSGSSFCSEALSVAQLHKMKAQPCVLFHLWATWCDVCVEELPKIIPFFSKAKGYAPVVIDVSSKADREKFSENILKKAGGPLYTYHRVDGDDDTYMTAVDPTWKGTLPYTVLFQRGKAIGRWIGETPLGKLESVLKKECKPTS